MGFMRYLFNYNKNIETMADLSIRIVEAEKMLINYEKTLEVANQRIETAAEIITVRDQELQEFDDLNTALNKEVKKLKERELTDEQVKSAEKINKAFQEMMGYNKNIAIKGV